MENMCRTMVGAACAYEVLALSTRKTPTLSALTKHSKVFEGLLLGTLLVHFHLEAKLLGKEICDTSI
jgi:hypothetical protein